MHRPLTTAALLALTLAACGDAPVRVERTPREFYTQRDPSLVERREGADEIRARVRNFAEGLARGDRPFAAAALGPNELTEVIGTDANGGVLRRGPEGLVIALALVPVPSPAVARTPDLEVDVSSRGLVGWFTTHLELLPVGGPLQDAVQMRATGVFQRDRGEWRLAQIHLSEPVAVPRRRPGADATSPDSAAPDSQPSRPAAAAPGGG